MQGATPGSEPAFAAQRRAMVDGQIRTFDVTDWRVIEAFLDVAREDFLPADLRGLAYSDAALSLGCSGGSRRGLLRPMHLARMLQGAEIGSSHRVMVVAGETGYAAALLARLAASVVSLESDPGLADEASPLLKAWGNERVETISGPLADGHAAGAPYDVILLQGAVETNTDRLVDQLADGGRLVMIEPRSSETDSGSGRAVRRDRFAGEVSRRVLFDAVAPVLPEFKRPAAFAF